MVEIGILVIHVLGAGVLFSTAVFSLVLATKKPVSKEQIKTIGIIEVAAPIAALVQLVSGVFLYAQNPTALNNSPVFWVKIVLYVCSGFLAVRIVKKKRMEIMQQAGKIVNVGTLPMLTVIEMTVLLAIIICGVVLVETL